MGRGTAARKRHIAEAMKNLGFMQGFGGIETARGALAENGNPPPELDVQDAFVSVTEAVMTTEIVAMAQEMSG